MLDARFLAEAPEAVGLDAQKVQALLARVEREVREGALNAAQVAIARHGKLAASAAYGRVRHEGRETQATPDTVFCVFSCTKAVTSALAWQLLERGQLGLSERAADIVPEFGTNGKEVVTVEQLLLHTAGFPSAPYDPARWLDHEERMRRFAKWRLNWEPGSRFEYHASSSMYVVAEILERRTGTSYAQLVRERIAEPLGLPDLRVGMPRAEQGRIADIEHVGEEPSDAEYAAAGVPKPDTSEVNEAAMTRFNGVAERESGIPGGGGTMTAAALALFYQALLASRAPGDANVRWERAAELPWKPEALRMACEVRTGELIDPWTGVTANRGLGIAIAGDAQRSARGFGTSNSALAFGHNGAGGQIAWADPATGISLAFCTSSHDRSSLHKARRMVAISSLAASCLR